MIIVKIDRLDIARNSQFYESVLLFKIKILV